MSDVIEWPVTSEVLDQLGQMLSKPQNPISIFGPIRQIPQERVKLNSDILREKGIKDAVGNLSPAFHRVLSVLSDPEALVDLKMVSGTEKLEWLVYFGRNLNQKILYSILPSGSFLSDPFSLDHQIETILDWTGGSALKKCSLELTVSLQEAMIFALFLDFISTKKNSRPPENDVVGSISFNLDEITQLFIENKSNQASLIGILINKNPALSEIEELNLILQQMNEKGICQSFDGQFSFVKELQECLMDLTSYELLFFLDLYKYHRTSGHISHLEQLYVQKGVRNMIFFDFLEKSVVIKWITPKEFLNNYIFSIQEKIHQIPDPQPEVLLPTATVILNSSVTSWRLIPQNGGQPIDIKENTKIGRHPKNQIVITEPSVSRWHAQLEIRSGDCWITDLGSSNGTFVNENRIQTTTPLRKSDRIRIGPLTLVLDRSGDDPFTTEKSFSSSLERKPVQYCSGCGKPAQSGARFCDQCGTQLLQ
jgi:hypothetical protein